MNRTERLNAGFDQELLNYGIFIEMVLDVETLLENGYYEVDGADELLEEITLTDFIELTDEEFSDVGMKEDKIDTTPLYFKSVPSENTASHLDPYGA